MKQVLNLTRIVLVLVFLAAVATSAQAQGIKERMRQRLPVIVDLKAQGIIGETNRGYIDFVGAKKPQKALIDQENADRKAIYTQIAKQQKTSLALVEKRRAMQIAQRAKPGEFIQEPNGSWKKK